MQKEVDYYTHPQMVRYVDPAYFSFRAFQLATIPESLPLAGQEILCCPASTRVEGYQGEELASFAILDRPISGREYLRFAKDHSDWTFIFNRRRGTIFRGARDLDRRLIDGVIQLVADLLESDTASLRARLLETSGTPVEENPFLKGLREVRPEFAAAFVSSIGGDGSLEVGPFLFYHLPSVDSVMPTQGNGELDAPVAVDFWAASACLYSYEFRLPTVAENQFAARHDPSKRDPSVAIDDRSDSDVMVSSEWMAPPSGEISDAGSLVRPFRGVTRYPRDLSLKLGWG